MVHRPAGIFAGLDLAQHEITLSIAFAFAVFHNVSCFVPCLSDWV